MHKIRRNISLENDVMNICMFHYAELDYIKYGKVSENRQQSWPIHTTNDRTMLQSIREAGGISDMRNSLRRGI